MIRITKRKGFDAKENSNYITFRDPYKTLKLSLDASLQKKPLLFYSKAKNKPKNKKVSLILNKIKFIIVIASR